MSAARPLALDLFCCAGGVSKGLADAGFDVIGVDIEPQTEYVHPGRFVQADALRPPFDLGRFDFIWASPPCQDSSIGSQRWKAEGRVYPKLIEATREMLAAAGVPYCIENVVGAPIRPDLVLTGPMFGLKTYRRRHFEFGHGMFAWQPSKPPVLGPKTADGWFTAAGNGGHGPNRPRMWAEGMGVPWMSTKHQIRQAIPPVYAEYVGRAAMQLLYPTPDPPPD
jgi:DNA (cytosine-5)-methyltransferase 1